MNIRSFVAPLSCLLLTACAGVMTAREQPAVSDQHASEAGTLPVGRVRSVERVDFHRQRELSAAGLAAAGIGAGGAWLINSVRNADWEYRYVLEMKGGGTRTVQSPFVHEVGECLAFRSGLSASESDLPVRALPGECGDPKLR